MVYDFGPGYRVPGKPQQIGEALEAVRIRNGGTVTPNDIVKAARAKGSPLHTCFEWDDKNAARKYRKAQARYLLRAVVVVSEDGEEDFAPVRAFVSLGKHGKGGDAYTSITVAIKEMDLTEDLLERARDEIVGWRTRYKDLKQFAELFAAIDVLV